MAAYFLLFFSLISPQLVVGQMLFENSLSAKMITIHVRVDFGPAGPAVEKEVLVRERSTPREALEKILPIQKGAACCHPEEVRGIDGVFIDPLSNRWWRLKINGTTRNASPHKSRLKAGDVTEWLSTSAFDLEGRVKLGTSPARTALL